MLTQAQAQSYSFSSVQVEGNQTIETATIVALAGIGRGETVSAARLNDAYQEIVNSGLFQSVDLVPQGGTLLIRVVENPMINIVNFEGNARLKDEELAEIAKSKGRFVYSPSQAEEDAANIAEAYRLRGRIAATVEPRIIRRDGNRVDLVFEVTEGSVAEIERLSFVGNRAFSDRRLRQVLETKQAGLLRHDHPARHLRGRAAGAGQAVAARFLSGARLCRCAGAGCHVGCRARTGCVLCDHLDP